MGGPRTAHVVRIHAHGGPEALRWEEVPLPEPGPGEALVKHTAVGVNFIDVYHRSGLYPLPDLPHALGVEAAGVVEVLGPEVAEPAVGSRVAYVDGPGAYATHRVLRAERLVPLPADVDDETAAAVLLKGLTAEMLVRRVVRPGPGDTVLVHAAAGGVGLILCQWLASEDVTVIGTVGTAAKADLARAHGCAHPLVAPGADLVARVRALTGGRGVPVAYDSVGRDTFLRSLDCLARRGTLVSFGNASGTPEPLDPMLLGRKGSLTLIRPSLFDYVAARAELLDAAAALFDALRRGVVRVRVHRAWPLAQAARAHRALEGRATTGSSILRP